jgi:hypothetical protein
VYGDLLPEPLQRISNMFLRREESRGEPGACFNVATIEIRSSGNGTKKGVGYDGAVLVVFVVPEGSIV